MFIISRHHIDSEEKKGKKLTQNITNNKKVEYSNKEIVQAFVLVIGIGLLLIGATLAAIAVIKYVFGDGSSSVIASANTFFIYGFILVIIGMVAKTIGTPSSNNTNKREK